MKIVIYVIDCLRADHVSCYGYRRRTTPNIDTLAQEGMIFEQAFSPSTWTKPVAASLLTGLYPPVHGVRMRNDVMAGTVATLPEWLGKFGYATLAVSTIGNFSSSLGFGKGFDRFIDLYKEPALQAKRAAANVKIEKLHLEKQGSIIFPLAEDINEVFFPWIEKHLDQDFFVLLWAMDPHDPYHPPADWRLFVDPTYKGRMDGSRERAKRASQPDDLKHMVNLYDSEIAYTDYCFGQIIARLKHIGIYDQTAVLVLGDHGESFGDHGHMLHGHLPFEEIIHVPLILKLPGASYAGKRISGLVSLLDVMPTVLDMADIPSAKWGSLTQGSSLLNILDSPGHAAHGIVFSELKTTEAHNEILSLRTETWKYIWVKPSNKKNRLKALARLLADMETLKELLGNALFYVKRQMHYRHEYLYNVADDPHETQNLAPKMPHRARSCEEMLMKWLDECKESVQNNDGSDIQNRVDQETLDQLRALGYL
jgi:arylsulfatase A-like enzyme